MATSHHGHSTAPPAHAGRRDSAHSPEHGGHYRQLLGMAVLSYIAMYVLMYAMVDKPGNLYNNLNQVYMAALMAAPMLLIELVLMRSMYRNMRLNVVLAILAAVVMLLSWSGIRRQAGVTDQQFLRSMIPHHAGALLMCGHNHLSDPELQRLCAQILASQQREIDLMQSKLE